MELEKIMKENQIQLEDIPEIDLYMDQVIQLFENKFGSSKRNEEEKVLTKTMINNYAKGKLFFPVKNKKYTKEHLILIALIYQLKGSLSISDIKTTMNGINDRIVEGDFHLDHFYQLFLDLTAQNLETFKNDLQNQLSTVKVEGEALEETASTDLEKVLMVSSLVHMSNLYRKAAERLVDDLAEEKTDKQEGSMDAKPEKKKR
ncbi:DUF1836 domain-containing protein [Bacillus sp. ISL-47]|uniref:DUF1836 domain-containing protein n=1 Tax=Bacillus sp. ISL-47 TaxID=2819130 RepID=UPI001BEB756C|nr:DUF1836 domain-containing protein [Bacillus sp. ISL-47]MBT2690110.1 DUF1836 domain-containing protein [Bacillus sp. ISL-47]MBT2711115.1 DUF1836 domain-containing protein [Pseudomonas sp. ISL-84]